MAISSISPVSVPLLNRPTAKTAVVAPVAPPDSLFTSKTSGAAVQDAKAALARAIGDPDEAREIEKLHPTLRPSVTGALAALREAGYPAMLVPKGGYRSPEEQDKLFAKGRDEFGNGVNKKKIVTGKRGGESLHNYGLAFDMVLRGKNGLPDDAASEKVSWDMAKIVRRFGLTWGSDPGATSIKYDDGHYQTIPFHTDVKALQAGPKQDIGGYPYPRLPDEEARTAAAEAQSQEALRGVKADLAAGKIPRYSPTSVPIEGGHYRPVDPAVVEGILSGPGDRDQRIRRFLDLGVRNSDNVDQLRAFTHDYGSSLIPPEVMGAP